MEQVGSREICLKSVDKPENVADFIAMPVTTKKIKHGVAGFQLANMTLLHKT